MDTYPPFTTPTQDPVLAEEKPDHKTSPPDSMRSHPLPRERTRRPGNSTPSSSNRGLAHIGQGKTSRPYIEKNVAPGAASTAPGMTPLPVQREVRIRA